MTEWISVKERLPEPFTTVLAYLTNGKICTVSYVNEFMGFLISTTVTYWMPLPEPPKENSEEVYVDDVGGIHSPCDCYNPYGYFCGDCGKLSCKDCKYRNLQPLKETDAE